MTTTIDQFLSRCSSDEGPYFRVVLEALDPVVVDSPNVLAWQLGNRALELVLTNADAQPAKQVPLLYFWPSDAKRTELPDSISTSTAKLTAHLSKAAVEAFDRQLHRAGFVREKTKGWRTETYNDPGAGRLKRVFGEAWGPKNVSELVEGVRQVVKSGSAGR